MITGEGKRENKCPIERGVGGRELNFSLSFACVNRRIERLEE